MARLKYDLHIHSCLSPCADDDMTPANIVGMAVIAGLDLIALTDHCSCKNCPAFAAAAGEFGMEALFGMELTTAEEVHVLCYFSSLEDSLEFDAFVYEHLPDIPNSPAFFGNQLIYDENDAVRGTEDRLLISATDIPFDQVKDIVGSFGGIMVPAHINKSSTSLLSNLGFVPPGSGFNCVEVRDPDDRPGLVQAHPYLGNCTFISSSDAHTLGAIGGAERFIEPDDPSSEGILRFLDMKKS